MNNIHIDTVFMTERKLLCARHIGPYQGIGAAFEELERELSRLGLRAEAMLAIYHDNPATVSHDSLRSDAAAQIADNDLITDTMLKPFTIGAGSFARWTHKGPYKDLHNTYLLTPNSYLLSPKKASPTTASRLKIGRAHV